ncbi:alpha/beta hydrolase [Pseudohoeflea sp. DP4N28-3]|uniref:Alpha/beta hydrolase n=1 Tax=Pseudohoeflea coraliihabitans TaxID=2860393 RepID=A0ABS6WK77_9HYPH|nr:alpha/beta hydrolase [Pseudohoeflea sp. DP4N28-3]
MSEAFPDHPRLYTTAANPIPERRQVGYFTGRDGKRIRYAIFRSKARVAKGTVVLLQGRNEFIEKYFETIRHLNDRGFWVATFDWRGQGGSERLSDQPLRGHVAQFSDYEADLSVFLETIVLPDTRLPFLLLGHSMGGLVALSAAPDLATRIDRMVVVAPFVDLSGQPLSQGVIYWTCRLLTLFGYGETRFESDRFPRPFDGNMLTSDRARYDRNQGVYEAWPQLRLGPPTAGWIATVLKAIRRVNRVSHLSRIKIPTLLIAAGSDRIVEESAIERLANRFRAGHHITIDQARHEILQEVDRYRLPALAAIDAFFLPAETALCDVEAASDDDPPQQEDSGDPVAASSRPASPEIKPAGKNRATQDSDTEAQDRGAAKSSGKRAGKTKASSKKTTKKATEKKAAEKKIGRKKSGAARAASGSGKKAAEAPKPASSVKMPRAETLD